MIKLILKIAALVVAALIASAWIWGDLIFPRTHGPGSILALNISPELRAEIDSVVKRKPNISGIQIVTVHFQRNIKVETYMSVDNTALQEIYDLYVRNKVVETPLFESEAALNTRTLKLINGEFICSPYNESVAFKYAPAGARLINTVCALGIPPHRYGEFTGILTIYLKDAPSKEEIDLLFLYSRELSIKIYEENPPFNTK